MLFGGILNSTMVLQGIFTLIVRLILTILGGGGKYGDVVHDVVCVAVVIVHVVVVPVVVVNVAVVVVRLVVVVVTIVVVVGGVPVEA